jgi:hypothetical protein
MWLIKDIDQDQLSIFPWDFFEATSLRNRAVLHYGLFLSGLARIELTWIKAMAFLVSNFRYAGIASRDCGGLPALSTMCCVPGQWQANAAWKYHRPVWRFLDAGYSQRGRSTLKPYGIPDPFRPRFHGPVDGTACLQQVYVTKRKIRKTV